MHFAIVFTVILQDNNVRMPEKANFPMKTSAAFKYWCLNNIPQDVSGEPGRQYYQNKAPTKQMSKYSRYTSNGLFCHRSSHVVYNNNNHHHFIIILAHSG